MTDKLLQQQRGETCRPNMRDSYSCSNCAYARVHACTCYRAPSKITRAKHALAFAHMYGCAPRQAEQRLPSLLTMRVLRMPNT
eukprot:6191576-Pleurochrysis_carterae.AAC.1